MRETKNGETLGGWVADVQGVAVGPSEGEVGLEEVYPASWTSQVRTREVCTRGKDVIEPVAGIIRSCHITAPIRFLLHLE